MLPGAVVASSNPSQRVAAMGAPTAAAHFESPPGMIVTGPVPAAPPPVPTVPAVPDPPSGPEPAAPVAPPLPVEPLEPAVPEVPAAEPAVPVPAAPVPAAPGPPADEPPLPEPAIPDAPPFPVRTPVPPVDVPPDPDDMAPACPALPPPCPDTVSPPTELSFMHPQPSATRDAVTIANPAVSRAEPFTFTGSLAGVGSNKVPMDADRPFRSLLRP